MGYAKKIQIREIYLKKRPKSVFAIKGNFNQEGNNDLAWGLEAFGKVIGLLIKRHKDEILGLMR